MPGPRNRNPDRRLPRGGGGGGQQGSRDRRDVVSLQRALPLYGGNGDGPGFFDRPEAQTFDAADASPRAPTHNPHPGLIFDKYIDTWSITQRGICSVQPPVSQGQPSPKTRAGSKRVFYDEQVGRNINHLATGLTTAIERQKLLVGTLQGDSLELMTDWRFVSGLGTGHPFEAGFIWHRTLGVPYIPGSSVKGLLRAWAKPESEGGWGGVQWSDDVKALFGDTKDMGAGRLIVFDALPTAPPKLEVDIMNPHYGDYYSGKTDANHNPIPPADYLSPNPIFFLAVAAGQEFRFHLAARPGAYRSSEEESRKRDLALGMKLLEEALTTIGAGGKTAVGYGVFRGAGTQQSMGLESNVSEWKDATLKWTKGNQTLVVTCGTGTAQRQLLQPEEREAVLGKLSQEFRDRLIKKCELSGVTVQVERVGNAHRIVLCRMP